MMTKIGEVTVGTLLKRVGDTSIPSVITKGRVYEVTRIAIGIDLLANEYISITNDLGKEWFINHRLYKIVGHVDDDIINELDQMLEFCLKYNDLENYIVNNA